MTKQDEPPPISTNSHKKTNKPLYPVQELSKLQSVHSVDVDIRRYPDLSEFSGLWSDNDDDDDDDFALEEPMEESEVSEASSTSSPSNSTTTTTTSPEEHCLEVAPGVFQLLRGGAEYTHEAWQRGDCIETVCYACNDMKRIACIQDCESVICPECFAISPVEGNAVKPGEMARVCIGIEIEMD